MPLSKSENRASILETMARWIGSGETSILTELKLDLFTNATVVEVLRLSS